MKEMKETLLVRFGVFLALSPSRFLLVAMAFLQNYSEDYSYIPVK